MKDIHPFEPFLNNKTNKLIIGTIPPHRYCIQPQELHSSDVNFYYGSRDNYFWDIIGQIFNKQFENVNTKEAIEQRKGFLEEINTGITDIIDSCERENESASDNKLKNIKYKDLKTLLDKNKQIETLIYTSEFVKRCINEYFNTYHVINKNNNKKQILKIINRTFDVHILYSPSPQALRNMGKNGHENRLKQYIEVFKKA